MLIVLTALYAMDRAIYHIAGKEQEIESYKERRSGVSILQHESDGRSEYGNRSVYQIHKMRLLQKIFLRRHQNRSKVETIAGRVCREQWKSNKKQ